MSEDMTQHLPDDALRQILARFDSLDARVTALEEKVDRRLQDTRPIWEQVLTRLTEVEEHLTKSLKKVQDEVFLLRRKFETLGLAM